MEAWAKLTPEQRKAAREKYQTLKKLPPDKRREVTAQWQRYQQSLAAQPEFSPSDPPAPPEPQTAEAAGGSARQAIRRHGHRGTPAPAAQ